MKTTDYAKIAARYDANKIRHWIDTDPNIGVLLEKAGSGPACVLDLACGTGNYLVQQIGAYGTGNVRWIGIDKSPEMLQVAIDKKLGATLLVGDACDLPLEDESVDYVKIRFAFHHFPDKKKALRETRRVLKKGGALSIFNLCHDYMRESWVYKYYPQVEAIDKERFPKTLDIYAWLEELGFDVTANVQTMIKRFRYEDIIEETRNRDMSQLNLISDEAWKHGLDAMAADGAKGGSLIGDISFMDFLARKRE